MEQQPLGDAYEQLADMEARRREMEDIRASTDKNYRKMSAFEKYEANIAPVRKKYLAKMNENFGVALRFQVSQAFSSPTDAEMVLNKRVDLFRLALLRSRLERALCPKS